MGRALTCLCEAQKGSAQASRGMSNEVAKGEQL